jgi:DNA-binding helix-hairpin-helix protein with protein kinase domain
MVEEPGIPQSQAPAEPPPPEPPPSAESLAQERRTTPDRRAAPLGRREEDRRAQMRIVAATLLAFCGALVVMYVFFAAIGAVDLVDAGIFTIIAVVLTLIWLVGAYQRARSGAIFVTRRDRERRGY